MSISFALIMASEQQTLALRTKILAECVAKALATGNYLFPTAIKAIDKCKHVLRVEQHFGAFVVACGGADSAYAVAIDGKAFNVEHATSDSLVGFCSAANT